MHRLFIVIYIINILSYVQCPYPPIGDEIQAGSVVLPASRRGRYLANIVRRQAVDGTGIKFNKDADRMNAEAKKKVDVLSEELLPYIIAEQERRTTLYKRVMTALQNGEKGVTIAEIRNKPPVIIRKGLMYRCPTNRAPKEPDGSGIIVCEDNIEPTAIMYESCLSAEDKELYVADNKYFFCNRHKVEGPDLPRNGTTVIGCAPCERTSLNYTSAKCALEDTDDVVVHYRYYPDRTYKFVTELDPDREVCEHWNPCQIGYIFSLPSPDQATPASELWQDTPKEHVRTPTDYETGYVKLPIPEGTQFNGVIKMTDGLGRSRISNSKGVVPDRIDVIVEELGNEIKIKLKFSPMVESDVTNYYASFQKDNTDARKKVDYKKYEYKLLFSFEKSNVKISPKVEELVPGQTMNTSRLNFSCPHCNVKRIMIKAEDGTVTNIPFSKYRFHKIDENNAVLELDLDKVTYADFGIYFAFIDSIETTEEKIKILTIKAPNNVLGANRLIGSAAPGEHYDGSTSYECADCEITDVLCRGESLTKIGRCNIIATNRFINFNFPSFEDSNACVFIALFKKAGVAYRKILGVLENKSELISISPANLVVTPPAEGEQFEQEISYKCGGSECSVDKVYINGVPLITSTRRTNIGSIPFYVTSDNTITIRITQYLSTLEGVEQAVFIVDGTRITKTLMEIAQKEKKPDGRRVGADADDITTEPDEESNPESTDAPELNDSVTESAGKAGGESTTAEESATSPAEVTTAETTTEEASKKKKQ